MTLTAGRVEAVESPRILLHIQPVTPVGMRPACEQLNITDCPSAKIRAGLSTPAGPFYFVYLVGTHGAMLNIAGMQCGLQYQAGQPSDLLDGEGIDIFSWNGCFQLGSPTPGPNQWPRPGGGILLWWDDLDDHPERCQEEQVVVYGSFYLGAYSADVLRVTPRPVDAVAKVANCLYQESPPIPSTDLGFVSFSADSSAAACNPCLEPCEFAGVPVARTTWSRIKRADGSR